MTDHAALRALAAQAHGAWESDWTGGDVLYHLYGEGGMYGVDSPHGPVGVGMCEEVSLYIAAANPSVVVGLLDEIDRLRACQAAAASHDETGADHLADAVRLAAENDELRAELVRVRAHCTGWHGAACRCDDEDCPL